MGPLRQRSKGAILSIDRGRAPAASGRGAELGGDDGADRPVLRREGGGPSLKAPRRFLSRLFLSKTRRYDEARLREEVEAHLRMQTAENVRAGMSPEEARRQAVLKFGPIEAIKGSYRDERGLPVVDDLLQ